MGITKSAHYEVAIEPAALVLKGKARDIYYEKKYPHVELTADIAAQILKEAPAEDRLATIARAKELAAVCKIIIEAGRV